MKRLILLMTLALIWHQFGTCQGANVMEESYSFTVIQDLIPPYIVNRFPANGSVGVPVDTVISATIKDDETGVNINSIIMKVNGVQISPTITGTQNEYKVEYQPGLLPWNHVISVDLSCTDLSDN